MALRRILSVGPGVGRWGGQRPSRPGGPAVQLATIGQDKGLGYGLFVVAPLPLDTPVRAVVGIGANGRQVARAARIGGVRGAVCRS